MYNSNTQSKYTEQNTAISNFFHWSIHQKNSNYYTVTYKSNTQNKYTEQNTAIFNFFHWSIQKKNSNYYTVSRIIIILRASMLNKIQRFPTFSTGRPKRKFRRWVRLSFANTNVYSRPSEF